jgi:hypothetical protein
MWVIQLQLTNTIYPLLCFKMKINLIARYLKIEKLDLYPKNIYIKIRKYNFFLVPWGSGNPVRLWTFRRRFDPARDYSFSMI